MSDLIQTFEIHHPDDQLDDLRSRLLNTRWPDQETVAGTDEPWSQGTPLDFARDVAEHWDAGLRLAAL